MYGRRVSRPFFFSPSLAAFLLGRISLSICAHLYGFWKHSRPARFSDDSLGKSIRRTFLHSEPLARIDRHVGNRSTFYLRMVARHAFCWQHSHRSPLADYGLRNAAFLGSRCWVNRLLPSSTPLACALEWSNGISDIEGKVARVATSK